MSVSGSFNIYIINYWVLIPAAIIIIILSLLEKRKSRQDVCHGRPALLIPFHFLDGYENRTAYAMAFGTTTSTVVSLIKSEHTLEFDLPLWATALYVYLQAVIGCLTCYPLFACLTTRYRAVGAVFCILYSLLWLALKLVQIMQEVEQTTSSDITDNLNDTFALNLDQSYCVLQGLPVVFCYLVLILYCFYILHICYHTKLYLHKHMDGTVKIHQEMHVRWVFRKFRMNNSPPDNRNCSSTQEFVNQMQDSIKLRYFTNFPFFKYPARIAALSFVQLNILFWMGLLLMKNTVSILYPFIHAELTQKYVKQYVIDLTVIVSVCSGIALIVCIVNALAQIFIGARNYRYDMLKIYQGSRMFVPVSNKTPQNILTRSMTFPGYQVAFMLWGILLCFTTVFLLTLIPVLCIYFAAKVDVLEYVITNLAQLLSFPATVLVLFYLQVFMTKQVLLQEKLKVTDENPPLNVDNRKFYEIINYCSLFTNMAVGLFTCLFRIIQSAFFGIFSVARLDRSVFPHDLESWDRGYAAYISMLLVDNAHNNPCMRVFAHLLWTKVLAARFKQGQSQKGNNDDALLIPDQRPRHINHGTDNTFEESLTSSIQSANPWIFVETNETQRLNRTITRWFLAYTLVNNPQLCKIRKQNLTRIITIERNTNVTNNPGERCSETEAADVSLLAVCDDSVLCSSFQNGKNNVLLTDVMDHQISSSFA